MLSPRHLHPFGHSLVANAPSRSAKLRELADTVQDSVRLETGYIFSKY